MSLTCNNLLGFSCSECSMVAKMQDLWLAHGLFSGTFKVDIQIRQLKFLMCGFSDDLRITMW